MADIFLVGCVVLCYFGQYCFGWLRCTVLFWPTLFWLVALYCVILANIVLVGCVVLCHFGQYCFGWLCCTVLFWPILFWLVVLYCVILANIVLVGCVVLCYFGQYCFGCVVLKYWSYIVVLSFLRSVPLTCLVIVING